MIVNRDYNHFLRNYLIRRHSPFSLFLFLSLSLNVTCYVSPTVESEVLICISALYSMVGLYSINIRKNTFFTYLLKYCRN